MPPKSDTSKKGKRKGDPRSSDLLSPSSHREDEYFPMTPSPPAANNFSVSVPGVNTPTSNFSHPGKTPRVTHSPNAALPPGTPALMVVLGLLVGTLIIITICRRKRRIKRRPSTSKSSPSLAMTFSPICFTYEELETATDRFSQQNFIGGGGFGNVFRGRLLSGNFVAIKKLKSGSDEGADEFRAEVEIISRLHHRNIVTLLGLCVFRAERMLVYEYIPNGTLEWHLHGNTSQTLSWPRRFTAALDTAKALVYCHHQCDRKIIHRDIKSSNILFDLKFRAKLADFGIAKESSIEMSSVLTKAVGTIGYVDPEYAFTGKLTAKSDVYSFGVLLLELVTGSHPTRRTQTPEKGIVDWAMPLLEEALKKNNYDCLTDMRLGSNYKKDEVKRILECTEACIQKSATHRPEMTQVLAILEQGSVNEQRLFGRDILRRWKSS